MDKIEAFLQAKLNGERFKEHSIPLEVLKDLAVLEEMVVEIAKHCFFTQNTDRARFPRGLSKKISFHLECITEGSAVAHIGMHSKSDDLFPTPHEDLFSSAREKILGAISAAENDSSNITDFLPPGLLGYFDRLGRSLKDNESITFSSERVSASPTLTRATRELLRKASNAQEVTEDIILRGSIPEIDQDRLSFQIQLADGQKLQAPLNDQHYDTILEAAKGYRDGMKVMLTGIAIFNRSAKLQKIQTVEHVSPLDSNDFAARADEILALKPGWLDGQNGSVPNKKCMDWLVSSFEYWYPDELPTPYLYPTAEGGVQLEWSISNNETTLEIDFSTKHGDWHHMDMETNDDYEAIFDLSKEESWEDIIGKLKGLIEKNG